MDENDFDFYDLEEATILLKEESESEESEANLIKEEIGSENEETEVHLIKKVEESIIERTKTDVLNEVIKSENEEREIPFCSECNTNYDHESDLLEHIKSVHNPKTAFCDLCCERLLNFRELRQHMKNKHGTKQNKSLAFVNKIGQNKVMKSNFKKELLDESARCTLCGKQFASNQKMVAHVAVVHSQGEAKCELCGNVFKHKYYLRAHMNYVHASSNMDNYQKWLLCDICCKSFKNAANLFSHKKHVHEVEPGLHCSLCTASAKNKYALRKHVKKCIKKDPSKRKMPKENQDFPCGKCSSQFSSESNLKLHHNYAHEILPTQCQLCYRRFKYYIHVRQHLRRIHSQEATHDLYLILNKDASRDEFLPKMEVDLIQEDPMLMVYKRQASRLFQQTITAHPGDDANCDTSAMDEGEMISEELNGIGNIIEDFEVSDEEKLLEDDPDEESVRSLLKKYSEIFEEIEFYK